MDFERTSILGSNISKITFRQTLDYCAELITSEKKNYICLAPAHSIMDCYNDDNVRNAFNASGLSVPDGMATVWILKIKGFKEAERVYGPALLLELSSLSVKNEWKNFFYGSSIQVLSDLEMKLREKFPDLEIAGTYSPPFTGEKIVEDLEVIDKINAAAPDIIWVGLGSPKQDLWMAEHRCKLNASILIGVGAAFDFLSGHKKQAPGWVQQNGLEWLFRFITEPKRLWRRYSKYPLFVILVLRELIRER